MHKRQFLATVMGTVALPALARAKHAAKSAGPTLLTVTGAIGRAHQRELRAVP